MQTVMQGSYHQQYLLFIIESGAPEFENGPRDGLEGPMYEAHMTSRVVPSSAARRTVSGSGP